MIPGAMYVFIDKAIACDVRCHPRFVAQWAK